MGSYHPTFCDRKVLETGYVDYVVRGEGEHIIIDLLKNLDNLEKVKGISYRRNGKIIRNPNAPPLDVSSLPLPARDLLKLSRYNSKLDERPMGTMISSRGCPFNCEFCSSSKFAGRRWRARSPKDVVDEMEILKKEYGYGAIYLLDDNFVLNPLRAIAISKEIIRRKIDIRWMAFSRVETIVNHKEMVENMAKAGLSIAFLGIESADPDILSSYKSLPASPEISAQAVKILIKYGIKTWASFMLGATKETEKTIFHTLRFAKKLNPHIVQFSILTPLPGTDLWKKVENRLIRPIKWKLFDCGHSVFKTDFLSPKRLQKLLTIVYIKFYLRPSRLWKELKDALKKRHLFRSLVIFPLRGIRTLKSMRV